MSRRSSVVHPAQPPIRVEAPTLPLETPIEPAQSPNLIPWLLLFAASGCSALIYEIVWFQLLQLVIGSSAVSLGLLLAAYMGGLCLGSVALPRVLASARGAQWPPLQVYAVLELGIGVFGLVALIGVPLVGHLYLAGATTGLFGLVVRGVVAAVCLLPPTLLMGASFPAIARAVERTPTGVWRLGFLYSANVAGAVIGCLAAGFYLLRVYDMAVATYVAAAINVAVAIGAWSLAARIQPESQELKPPGRAATRAQGAPLIYVAIALSGLTALGAEVVWTRLLSLLLGATVYTFSIILAVFLIGLWAGSSGGAALARRLANPRMALALCQILLAAGIAWTAFSIIKVLPYWPVDPWISTNPWFTFDLDMTRCLRAILLPTLLWGASFPLALAGAAAEGEDPARLAGEVYAANTAGSIVGALLFSLLLIPAIGTDGSQRLLIWLAAVGALTALGAAALGASKARLAIGGIAGVAALALAAGGLAATVSPVPWQLVAYGRRVAPMLRGLDVAELRPAEPLFVGEGMNASVGIAQRGDQRFFYISGKSEASSAPLDMRLQRMMGDIPALVQPAPRSVLVVGFGAGVTAGSFVPNPDVKRIVICELEKLIPPASDEFFGKENFHVLHDPRTEMVYDDARHYIFTAPETYDVITTDPIHPWVKGTSTLYSKEYFELVKSHLKPGGVVAQWLPIYDSDEQTVKTEMATFFSVFPNSTVWSNYQNGDGYDLVLLGRSESTPINIDALEGRLSQPSYANLAASLAEVGFHSGLELMATYVGRASDLAPLLEGVPINEDINLRLQYLAGLGLNSAVSPETYRDIVAYRRFPDGLLTGSEARIQRLRAVLGRRYRRF
jgi:spermidine synthase